MEYMSRGAEKKWSIGTQREAEQRRSEVYEQGSRVENENRSREEVKYMSRGAE